MRAGDFALAGVACAVQVRGNGAVERAAIGLIGLGATPLRAGAAEAALVGGTFGGADLTEIGRLAVADVDPPGDVHASAKYRRAVGAWLVTEALGSALAQATNGGDDA